jgi:hypothetical protein
MAIAFDRARKTNSLSMPGYVTKMLQRFRPQYLIPGHCASKTPGRYIPPSYTSTPQVVFIDTTDKLNTTLIMELQAIIGTLLLYYARAIDPTLLTIANELASQQAQPTQRVLKAANRVAESSVTAAPITTTL